MSYLTLLIGMLLVQVATVMNLYFILFWKLRFHLLPLIYIPGLRVPLCVHVRVNVFLRVHECMCVCVLCENVTFFNGHICLLMQSLL